jgi:hypothetical protein
MQLLVATALTVGTVAAAPAMAADPIKLGIGGYYTFYAVAGGMTSIYATDGSATLYRRQYFTQEGEIHFLGQTLLDNGTTVGINVELEGWNPGTNATNSQIDEAFIYAFGDWGRVELGSRDAASFRMYYGSPSALIGFGPIQGQFGVGALSGTSPGRYLGFNKAFFHTTMVTNTAAWQDASRINLFTPRIQGFQIGVGYAPKVSLPQPPFFGSTGLMSGPGGSAGICGYGGPTNISNCPTADYAWQDAFDIGVNYLQRFGDLSVAVYGSWAHAGFKPGFSSFPTAASQVTGSNLGNWVMWAAGLQFGYKGVTVGGSIGYDNQAMGANFYTGQDNATRFASAGIMYETGAWQMSFMWTGAINNNGNGSNSIQSITAGTQVPTLNGSGGAAGTFSGVPGVNSTAFSGPFALAFGAETATKFEVGANYTLGPGVKLTGGALFINQAGPTNAVSGTAWALLLGIDLRF